MKILIASDVTMYRCNGRYYCFSPFYSVLTRYFASFGKVAFCGKATAVAEAPAKTLDATDMLASVTGVSWSRAFLGWQNKQIEEAAKDCDLIVCRVPGLLAYRAADVAKKLRKPYYTESMGCAWDAYWNHGLTGKIIAPYMFLKMKSVVRNADFALYVTREFLQKRYPCKKQSVGVSNVKITDVDDSILARRLAKIEAADPKREIVIATTAAVDVRYKGQEYVIRAIPKLNKLGIRVKYVLIGGGDQTFLTSVARKCGVLEQVEFAGLRPLDEVFQILDDADFYAQPSLQEGLPRSVIEAMSRGCPCIGARTAGIPELIAPECVVGRKSVQDVVDALSKLAVKEKMIKLAKENFENAKNYRDDVLGERRNAYYDYVKSSL